MRPWSRRLGYKDVNALDLVVRIRDPSRGWLARRSKHDAARLPSPGAARPGDGPDLRRDGRTAPRVPDLTVRPRHGTGDRARRRLDAHQQTVLQVVAVQLTPAAVIVDEQ